jgi:chorismate dehydratase
VPFNAKAQMNDTEALDAVLIIGDKVITQSLDASLLKHQLDLGEAWFNLTGLPFVFATWLCHADAGDAKRAAIASAARLLKRTRLRNAIRLPQIAARAAAEHGWPVDVAQRYFTKCLRFELDSDARRGLRRFFDLVGGETALARLRYFESD